MPPALALVLSLVLAAGATATGCQERTPPNAPPSLAAYLGSLAGADEALRAREVASWKLDRATWARTVVAPYDTVYDDYARRFDAAAPALVVALARPARVTTRAHYAGDPRLTLGQARARWALPVQYPSEVAVLATGDPTSEGVSLDVVFVRDGQRWRAITGLDAILRERAHALDPRCARYLDVTGPGRCAEIGWVIADALLRTDTQRFARACTLAENVCVVNGPP